MKAIDFHNLANRLRMRKGESLSSQFGRDARADWQIVVIVFLLLNIVSATAHFFMYQRVNRGEIFLVPKQESASLPALNRAKLDDVAALLEKKKKTFDLLRVKAPEDAGPGTLRVGK
jgi:hypothetical protein